MRLQPPQLSLPPDESVLASSQKTAASRRTRSSAICSPPPPPLAKRKPSGCSAKKSGPPPTLLQDGPEFSAADTLSLIFDFVPYAELLRVSSACSAWQKAVAEKLRSSEDLNDAQKRILVDMLHADPAQRPTLRHTSAAKVAVMAVPWLDFAGSCI